MTLTLTDAGLAVPSDRRSAQAWAGAVAAARAHPPRSFYHEVVELMHLSVGVGPLMPPPARPPLDFPCAEEATQADLARAAIAALDPAKAIDPLGLLIYATGSVDEQIFRSTVAWLATEFGWSALPHFALGQLGQASLPGAIEIAEAMLPPGAGDVLVVAGEKHPFPSLRLTPVGTVLGDAAAALRFSTAPSASGLAVIAARNTSVPPLFTLGGATDPAATLDRLADIAADAVSDLLAAIGGRGATLLAPGGYGAAVDRLVAYRSGCMLLTLPDHLVGADLGAAAMPVALAALLHGSQEPGPIVLWGASLSGAVGALAVHRKTPLA